MPAVTSNAISIGELAQLTGVSAHTLRFYEGEGILRPVGRAANGHRRYHREDILWLEFVLRLKLTGMPLAEIKQYAALRAQGEKTMQQRVSMLQLHRERLAMKMNELSACASVLDEKIRTYGEMIARSPAPRKRTSK